MNNSLLSLSFSNTTAMNMPTKSQHAKVNLPNPRSVPLPETPLQNAVTDSVRDAREGYDTAQLPLA
ncbi:MAG: hypothetical protein R3F41_20470 [Gammaproteobacteria bacterium]|nr:hypothetical protein [Pseudomonadales bacterium]